MWRYLRYLICLCFLLVGFSSATANESAKWETKCNSLKAKSALDKNTNNDAYVIWDAASNKLLGCSNSGSKEKKLNEKLKILSEDTDALAEFLSFREDSSFIGLEANGKKGHNIPIFGSLLKVKKERDVASKAFGPDNNFGHITRIIDQSKANEASSKEYIFVRSPDNRVEKKCVLLFFPDGHKAYPDIKKRNPKSCIFKTLPIHFELVPLNEIKYPTIFISGDVATEGELLNFTVTKQGEQSLNLSSTFSYDILNGSTSDDDLEDLPVVKTITFAPDEYVNKIPIQTKNDNIYEGNEQIGIKISDPINGMDKTAYGTITDNDPKAILSVSVKKPEVKEGEILEFLVKREVGSSNLPVTVNYEFVSDASDNSLADAKDFESSPDRIQLSSTDTSKTIFVKTYSDELNEGPEGVTLKLSVENDREFKSLEATATIANVEIETKICWDNSIVIVSAACPKKTYKTCPDGTEIPTSDKCAVNTCWDGTKRNPCPPEKATVKCPDESVVEKLTDCPIAKTVCWDGEEVSSLAECKPCTLKPIITSVIYPRGSERNVLVKGKACSLSDNILAANDRVDETKSAKADENGNFEIVIAVDDFFPEDEFLALQMVSAFQREGELDATERRFIIGEEITSFIKPHEDCPIPEPQPIRHPSLPTLEGLSIKPLQILKKGANCVIEVEVVNNSNEDATLRISYNPDTDFDIPKNSTTKQEVVITQDNVGRENIPIRVGLLNTAMTKSGLIKTPKDIHNDRVRKALQIYLSRSSFVGVDEDSGDILKDIKVTSEDDGNGSGAFKFFPVAKDRVASPQPKKCLDTAKPTLKCAQSFLDGIFYGGTEDKGIDVPSIAKLNVKFVKYVTEKNGEMSEVSDFKLTRIADETSKIKAPYSHYNWRDYTFGMDVQKSVKGAYFADGKVEFTYQPLSGPVIQSYLVNKDNIENAILVKNIPLNVDVNSGKSGLKDWLSALFLAALLAIFGEEVVSLYRGTRGRVRTTFLMLSPDFRKKVSKNREINEAMKERFGAISDLKVLKDGLWQEDAPSGENWTREKYRDEICKYAFDHNKLNDLINEINSMRPNFDSIERL